jgi:hypothetical protein
LDWILHVGWIQDAVTELQIEPITQSEKYIYMITSIQEDINDGLLRFAFIPYSMAIGERGRTRRIVPQSTYRFAACHDVRSSQPAD